MISHLGVDKNVIPEDIELLDMLAVQLEATLRNSDYIILSNQKLNQIQLNGAKLFGSILNGTSLIEANFERARLDVTSLIEANFERANLNNATLIEANLEKANLEKASLIGATLIEANLDRVSFIGTRLDGASLEGASLVQADLKNVKGLTIIQLIHTASLKDCKNLDPKLKEDIIEAGYRRLFR